MNEGKEYLDQEKVGNLRSEDQTLTTKAQNNNITVNSETCFIRKLQQQTTTTTLFRQIFT